MKQTGKFRFASLDGFDAIRVPYADDSVSMNFVVPSGEANCWNVLREARFLELSSVLDETDERTMTIHLPKLKLEQTLDLKSLLKKMGMIDVFDPERADFGGMFDDGNGDRMFISKVIQKTFTEINENGTEAAAATGTVMQKVSLQIGVPELRLNKPFGFFLTLNGIPTPLIVGRVCKL